LWEFNQASSLVEDSGPDEDSSPDEDSNPVEDPDLICTSVELSIVFSSNSEEDASEVYRLALGLDDKEVWRISCGVFQGKMFVREFVPINEAESILDKIYCIGLEKKEADENA
jgi:hypothetical protein